MGFPPFFSVGLVLAGEYSVGQVGFDLDLVVDDLLEQGTSRIGAVVKKELSQSKGTVARFIPEPANV